MSQDFLCLDLLGSTILSDKVRFQSRCNVVCEEYLVRVQLTHARLFGKNEGGRLFYMGASTVKYGISYTYNNNNYI